MDTVQDVQFNEGDHSFSCPLCLTSEPKEAIVTLTCGHRFHIECIVAWLLHATCPTCPTCHELKG